MYTNYGRKNGIKLFWYLLSFMKLYRNFQTHLNNRPRTTLENVFEVFHFNPSLLMNPQWGAADAEIKVPSGENTELKRSPFKAWSRSVYSHTCYTYSQGFLSCLFLHFRSIHLHFFQNLSQFFLVLAVANTWFLCRPAK